MAGVATSHRPAVTGVQAMVSAGHYLAAAAGARIFQQGGNAIDAGVAAGIAINVVLPNMTSFAGVAPVMVYKASTGRVTTIDGLGTWPQAASIELFRRIGEIPVGVLRAVVPAAADAWLTALRLYGTMSFGQVVQPAIELAEGGFVVNQRLHNGIQAQEATFRRWPSSGAVFLPNGRVPQVGEVLHQPDLARTLRRLAEAEKGAPSREAGLQAARDVFYKGDIAREMARFYQEQVGLITAEDFAGYQVRLEPPVSTSYRGYEVHACGPWCQGPVIPQVLNLLEGFDLRALRWNSPRYAHLVTEALKLVYGDRHKFYGDPAFVDVPLKGLLAKEYAEERRAQIDPERAYPEMPPFGNPWPYEGRAATVDMTYWRLEAKAGPAEPDTSYVCAVDAEGNAFSATPSDSFGGSPIVPGLGMIVSNRGTQSWLEPDHASSLQPCKRPRLTPNPAMVLKDGKVLMAFGTPGGDMQCQAMVQMLLNILDFGMDPQSAIEAPRFSTWSFPNSFWPHTYYPGLVRLEGRIAKATGRALERLGHRVEWWPDWTAAAGGLCAVLVQNGTLVAGADPRRESYAIGW